MSRVAAVILAGGKGERLGGVNKALLEIGGKTLLAHAEAVTAGCNPVLLSIGGTPFQSALPQVRDLDTDYAGPLAGVAAAVEHLLAGPPDLLLTLAVDTPFFPADFLARAMRLLAAAPVAIGAFGAQDYPTNGVWRFPALAELPAAVRAGTAPHSLKRLASGLGAVRLDYAPLTAADPFANVNTPEDLAFFRASAARLSPL